MIRSSQSSISAEGLLEDAAEMTGLDDFGELPFMEALGVLVRSLNEDADLQGPAHERAVEVLTGVLVKRLRLVDDREVHPQIADEKVTAPIFIVGPPRSGSTHLHALLSCVAGLRAPLMWEMSAPSPPPDRASFATDPRIGELEASLDQLPEELLVRHPMSAVRPEQCNLLNDWAFVNQAWMASFDVPSYREWFLTADYGPAYEAHRRTLQQLQWLNPGRWVLKYPKHLLSLDALLSTYPDALLIWTHRDPLKVIPSVLSLTGLMREANTPNYDPKKFGCEWTVLEEMSLLRGMARRDSDAMGEARNLDLTYRSIVADPIGVVESVCAWAGVDLGAESLEAIAEWVDSHPQDQHGLHRYTLEEFGLDPQRIRQQFSFYTDRFGVES